MWIYGAGGFGRETLDACLAAGVHVDGFIDDFYRGSAIDGLEVQHLADVCPTDFVVAIADPHVRQQVHESLVRLLWRPRTVIDPRSICGSRSVIGLGSVILAQSLISCDVVLGPATHINYGASVGHDVAGGGFVTVLPGATVGGAVRIGDRVLVGSGASVIQSLELGRDVTVGAGAVVTRSIEPGATVAGVPARPL